jgi:SanA protein
MFRRGAVWLLGAWCLVIAIAYFSAARHILTPADLPHTDGGLVLGASVLPDKRPSAVLRDRVVVASELLKAGAVDRLLLSGKSEQHYDEIAAMRRAAMDLGITSDTLLVDVDGLRTYDSCFHAKHVFGFQSVVIVTQHFHLPRAIFLCRAVGLEAYGIAADRSTYSNEWKFNVREIGAWMLAIFDAI